MTLWQIIAIFAFFTVAEVITWYLNRQRRALDQFQIWLDK